MKKASFKKNDILTLNIEDITDLGFGVARHEGVVVFVSDTVPGDVVRASVIKVNSSYLVARVFEFIKKSDKREMRCPEVACKSCAYRLISYEEEVARKEQDIKQLFMQEALSHISVMPLAPSPSSERYRNKAQYPIAYIGGKYEVGFYAPKSHRVCPISDCPLTPEIFSDIVLVCKEYFKKYRLPVYNEVTGDGLLRHIYLRRGEVSGEVLLTLVVTSFDFVGKDEFVNMITAKFPEVVGILLNKNDKDTNVVLGEEYKTLYGRDYIFDTLAGVKLKITAPSFYQVNHGAAELLYKKAKELANPTKLDTLLDLYCGAGSIGLSMANAAGEVIGIEIVESAVLCARENAKASALDTAKFFAGDAKNTEKLLARAECELGRKIKPDIIILDPPRGGCAPELIDYVSTLSAKRIVYISCNPKTLARDLILFSNLGYKTNEVYPYDLFPMSGHVECVVCLEKEKTVHRMSLYPEPFEHIKCGKKKIELRLWDEKRRKIKVGDSIVFKSTKSGEELTATVLKLHRFASFEELYLELPLLECGYTEEDIDTASPCDMYEYYSADEVEKYGVVGIEISLAD